MLGEIFKQDCDATAGSAVGLALTIENIAVHLNSSREKMMEYKKIVTK